MSVSPWMTLMTVFIVQFSILRSSRSLTSVYLDGDNWLIIWWSESGIKVWGGGGGTAHTVRGRGPSIITDQVWGCSHAALQQLIVLRNTELWPLWQGMHLRDRLFGVRAKVHSLDTLLMLISSDSDTIHYTNHSWLMNSIFVNCCLGVELDNERQNSADCMHH